MKENGAQSRHGSGPVRVALCGWGLSSRGVRRGFTLVEILVTITIIAILISLVLPIAGRTVAASRGFKCQMAQRSIAYDFSVFTDDTLHGFRGNDASGLTFTLQSFQDSQYCTNDFWCWPGETRHDMPDDQGNDPMRCPEVRGEVTLRSNLPCNSGGVSPTQNVSYGFNIRLRVAEQVSPTPGASLITLTSRVFGHATVPLLWDVDGEVAAQHEELPFFSGPSLNSPSVFANDQFWFPALRHNGAANFAFLDGHVESSRAPLATSWDWGFTP